MRRTTDPARGGGTRKTRTRRWRIGRGAPPRRGRGGRGGRGAAAEKEKRSPQGGQLAPAGRAAAPYRGWRGGGNHAAPVPPGQSHLSGWSKSRLVGQLLLVGIPGLAGVLTFTVGAVFCLFGPRGRGSFGLRHCPALGNGGQSAAAPGWPDSPGHGGGLHQRLSMPMIGNDNRQLAAVHDPGDLDDRRRQPSGCLVLTPS